MHATETDISRALQWLLQSKIQSEEGGVARFYQSDKETYRPVSTEITGYHASTLTWLFETTGNEAALARAVATADFLVDCAWDRRLCTFPFEFPHPSPAYFFDCGIIVRGLLAVWRVTRATRYYEVALRCAEQMLRDFDAGFDFHPIIELPGKHPALRDPRWSRSSGCYQLKSALAWHELGQDHPGLKQAWNRLLSQCLDGHDQFLPGHTDEERVMDRLHAYCYFLEALLVAPQSIQSARALSAGIQRVAYLLHSIKGVFVRSDVYAQLLRARLYADASGVLPLDTHTAALEAERLADFQCTSADPRVDGGFCFGQKGDLRLPYVNPVSTNFAVQALHLWRLRQSGSPLTPVSGLV